MGMVSSLLVYQLGQARVWFAMSRDGLLPKSFSNVHPRFRTPHVSTWVAGIAVAVPSGIFDIGTFADLSNIGTLFAFVLVSLAVLILRRTQPDRSRGFHVPWVPALPILSVLTCVLLMATLTLQTLLPFFILLLDHYGRFPFESLPRSYKAAVAKFTKAKREASGVLPWQIGVYSEKLTNAMRLGKWDEARLDAALLAHFVAEAHDPFNTTENFDGRLSGQPGVDDRFKAKLVDRFSSFFPMRPNDAVYLSDPTDVAFEACLSAHSWLETILLADRRARKGLGDYTAEYYDRLYPQGAAILIRQLSDAATDVGSFWLTAWKNAGSPPLPQR